MARMTKAELQYELQRIHDEQALEIKQQVHAQQEEAEKLAKAKTHIQEAIEKFEDVSDLGGLTLDQWLKQEAQKRAQSDDKLLLRAAECHTKGGLKTCGIKDHYEWTAEWKSGSIVFITLTDTIDGTIGKHVAQLDHVLCGVSGDLSHVLPEDFAIGCLQYINWLFEESQNGNTLVF